MPVWAFFLCLEDMLIYDKIILINLKYRMEIMRKFFVSLLFCGMFFEVYAATYNCKVQDIGVLSFKSSNEYLFVNTADYNHSNGRALVCGHKSTDGCDDNTMVYVTGHHYHRNMPRTDAWFYRCSSRGGNSWDAVGSTGFNRCSSIDGMRVITTVGSNDIYVPESEYVEYVSSGYYVSDKFCFLPHADGNKREDDKKPSDSCPYDKGTELYQQCTKCFDAQKNGHSNGWDATKEICKCASGKTWNVDAGKCIAGQDGDEVQTDCSYLINNKDLFNQCALCNKEKDALWNKKANKCYCFEGKEWDKERGKCVVIDGKDDKDDKDDNIIKPIDCISTFSSLKTMIDTYCVDLKTRLEQYMTMCNSGYMTVENFNAIYLDLSGECDVIIKRNKANNEQAKQKLVTAAEKLDTMFAGFKVSKWKNEEGKFNTARLASDSIAGVVLGTTGGLITSSVMKKKQVEQGFEDLQCTVGGQPVAGWGDEFMVGIQ